MRLFFYSILIIQCSPALAYVHTVSRNETLSELCYRIVPGRVYGKNGSVQRIARLNPHIKVVDLVYPGQKIIFPDQLPRTDFVTQDAPLQDPKDDVPLVVAEPKVSETKVNEPKVELKKPASPDSPQWAPSSRLFALMGQEYFDINSEDKVTKAKANFASNASPRIDVVWEVAWTKEYTSRIYFTYVAESIQNDATANKNLKRANGGRNSFGLEVMKNISDKTAIGIYGARSTRSFSRAPDNNTLTFDRISGFEVGAKAERLLFQVSKAKVTGNVKAGWLAPTQGAGYKVYAGKTATLGLNLRHELRAVTLEAQTYYGYWQQDSRYTKQYSSQIGMGIGASWRFDE